jgi:hypothetical protein
MKVEAAQLASGQLGGEEIALLDRSSKAALRGSLTRQAPTSVPGPDGRGSLVAVARASLGSVVENPPMPGQRLDVKLGAHPAVWGRPSSIDRDEATTPRLRR